MTDVLAAVRGHVTAFYTEAGITSDADSASVTFLGAERIEVLRVGPDTDGVNHYVSLGCSRHPMTDPTELMADATHGPRAEVVLSLRGLTPQGLSRSVAVMAAAPAIEGLVLEPDALIDLSSSLWENSPFTAVLLSASELGEVALPEPLSPVTILAATPITPTEAAWVRLKGADAMREAWRTDGVDVLDPRRRAASPS